MPGSSPRTIDSAVRRNTALLAAAQCFVQMAFPVLLVIGGPAATDLSGREGASGLMWAVYFLSAAAGAFLIGRWMDRAGRRPGLAASYIVVGITGVACAASIQAGSFPALLACTIPFGVAVGGANLVRGAVADMHPPSSRGRAIGLVLAAGTLGAVGSPLLAVWLKDAAFGWGGLDPAVVPWVIVPVGASLALACVLAVRPDPSSLAVGDEPGLADEPARSPGELLRVPAFRVALLAAAVGQMAMIGVMGVTPSALHHMGHRDASIALIISVHIAGMFLFAPLIGVGLDRFGRRAGLLAGCGLSVAGALIAATEGPAPVVGTGLFAIGVGWSATFLGATAVISDMTRTHERAGALGLMDLIVSVSSAAAGLLGGILLEALGYGAVGIALGAMVTAVLLLIATTRISEPGPEAVRG